MMKNANIYEIYAAMQVKCWFIHRRGQSASLVSIESGAVICYMDIEMFKKLEEKSLIKYLGTIPKPAGDYSVYMSVVIGEKAIKAAEAVEETVVEAAKVVTAKAEAEAKVAAAEAKAKAKAEAEAAKVAEAKAEAAAAEAAAKVKAEAKAAEAEAKAKTAEAAAGLKKGTLCIDADGNIVKVEEDEE